jgi:hypothetical protein
VHPHDEDPDDLGINDGLDTGFWHRRRKHEDGVCGRIAYAKQTVAAVVKRPVNLNCATTVVLNGLMTIGTPIEDVLMGVLHEERCRDVDCDKGEDCNLLLYVLHLPIQCMHLLSAMQEFSFIAFLSNMRYLLEKEGGI